MKIKTKNIKEYLNNIPEYRKEIFAKLIDTVRKNIPNDQIEKRMRLQMSESQKKKLAHTSIENNNDISELYTKLELYWRNLNII